MLSLSLPRLAAGLVLCLVLITSPVHARSPFDPTLTSIPANVQLPRWEHVAQQLVHELPLMRSCLAAVNACTGPPLVAWRQALQGVADAPWQDRLSAVNLAVNRTPYHTDAAIYGTRDHWATPLEFFTRNTGDCEDFAIAKYASLRLLGIPASSMRILVVEDVRRNLAHAVLVVREGTHVWLLDNLDDQVRDYEDSPQYDPFYAVNEEERWLHRLPTGPLRSS
ncbi:MAG: transglutaminase-like cysteine peptidase [Pseudomonadota bacterium]